jgi:hypothetical protein
LYGSYIRPVTDQLDRLRAALADRYAIERELGAGGMATVYLAQDLKHDRRVAVCFGETNYIMVSSRA